MATTTTSSPGEEFQFVHRLTARATSTFPVLSTIWDKATSLYTRSVEAVPAVKYGAGKLSTGLSEFKRVSERQLKSLDTLGCRGLDNLETAIEKSTGLAASAIASAQHPAETLQAARVNVKHKVEDATASIAHAVGPKVAAYVDVEKLPSLNAVLHNPVDETLKTLERFVPEESRPVPGADASTAPAAQCQERSYVKRAARVSARASKQLSRSAYEKLATVTLRSAERLGSIIHVDLIKYASGARDATRALATKAAEMPSRVVTTAKALVPKKAQDASAAVVAALPVAPYKNTGHVIRDSMAWATATVPVLKTRVKDVVSGIPIAPYKSTGRPVRDVLTWGTDSAAVFMLFVQTVILRHLPEAEPLSPNSKDTTFEGKDGEAAPAPVQRPGGLLTQRKRISEGQRAS